MENGSHHSPLYLIGFRIEPDIFEPQLYTIYVDGDRPILLEGRPIVFTKPELASVALNKSDCGASNFGSAPSDLYTVFDITKAIYLLNTMDEVTDSELLDFFNVLLDFINCIDEPMPNLYRSHLSMIADHLTFNYTIGLPSSNIGLSPST